MMERILTAEQMAQLKRDRPADIDFVGTLSACGAPNDLPECDTHPTLPQPFHEVIQVAVVEDDQQTRINLRVNLRSQDGIEVASEATNAETGLVLLESIDVDVAVVDATLPDMDLAKFIRMARKVQANSYVTPSRILVLVTPEQRSLVSDALAAGADSFCLVVGNPAQLRPADRGTLLRELLPFRCTSGISTICRHCIHWEFIPNTCNYFTQYIPHKNWGRVN